MNLRSIVETFLGTQQRTNRVINDVTATLAPTMDVGHTDYAFWSLARQARAKGIELGALLLKPLESKIAAWTIGRPPTILYEKQSTADFVADWWKKVHPTVIGAFQDSLGLGDSFVLVNPDLTVVVLPPDTVKPIVDEKDYTKIVGWRVTQIVPHPEKPNQRMRITNEFTENRRKRFVTIDGRQVFSKTYNNLIGMVPLVHIPNNAASFERFGHPEGECLLPLMQRYNEIFLASMEGNIRQGRPTPVISGLGTPQEVEQFWKQYGKDGTQEMPDGTVERYQYIEFDADKVVTLGGDAEFSWQAPGAFTQDTQTLLKLLFYLYLQHSELPEFILGNAVQTGNNAGPQVEPLIKFIEKKRTQAQTWITQLVKIAVAYNGLSDTAAANDEEPAIFWERLTRQDGSLTLQTVQWAYISGLIDRKTALTLIPVEIANPEQVLTDAEEDYPNRPVQGYPRPDGANPGSRYDPQKLPTDNGSERSRRRSGVGRDGEPRNKRSDANNPSPYANSGEKPTK